MSEEKQIEFNNYLERKKLLAMMQVCKFESMLKKAVCSLPEEQKAEYVKFIEDMEGERINLGKRFRDILNS